MSLLPVPLAVAWLQTTNGQSLANGSYCRSSFRGACANVIPNSRTGAQTDCAKWLNGRGVGARYDGTVRNSLGDIVQFVYGEDGLDAVYIEGQKVDFINSSHKAFEKKFRIDVMDPSNKDLTLSSDELEMAQEIQGDIDVQRLFDEEFEAIRYDREKIRKGLDDNDDVLHKGNTCRILIRRLIDNVS